MMVRKKTFRFIAGVPALDFLNTEVVAEGRPVDLLDDFSDVVDWLVDAGLADRGVAAEMRTLPAARSARLLAELKDFRRELRSAGHRLAAGQRLRKTDIEIVNVVLSRGSGSMFLAPDGDAISLRYRLDDVSRYDPLVIVALSVAEFLASADLSLVRTCEGTGCILFFYDTTKSHTRRWCSMAGCGNRMKATLFYQRGRGNQKS